MCEQYSSGHRRQQTTHLTLQCPTDDELLARILNQYKADLTKTTPRSTSSSVLVTQTHLTNKMEHMPKSALQAHSPGSRLSGQLRMNSAVCANEGSLRLVSTVLMMSPGKRTRPPTTMCFHRLRATGFPLCVLWQKMKLALRTLWRSFRTGSATSV